MGILRLFKKKINSKEVEIRVVNKTIFIKTILFVCGALISAISFNLFCVQNNFVLGGLGGIAVILNKMFSINSTLVIFIGNVIFVIISLFTIGTKKSLLSIVGAAVYTAFVYFTNDIVELINFHFDNVLLYVLAAGIVGGFGEGLVYKSGFKTGGTSILAVVLEHYTKRQIGELLRYMAYIIIIAGGVTMGYTAIMYSLIITTISTQMVDKILIGINYAKTIFIQTSKDEEVTDFILNVIKSGVTELDTKGAFTHKKKKMLMCVVPKEKYSLLRSAVKEIDEDAFIVVSDCYEVLGGTKKSTISLENL